ncbi:uncharacterized protein TNCV_605491 [Trichonephila clavipes]|nr:uncharacterized protein TNCV_605491 [Trichonephila clavipes]
MFDYNVTFFDHPNVGPACVISWHKIFYAFFIEGCRLCLQPVGNIFFQLFVIVEVFTGKERLEISSSGDNSKLQREFNRFEGQGVGDNRRFDSRRRSGQSDHRFHNQGGRQGGSRNGAFRGQNGQNRLSSLRMTPVDLPYIPILLNELFITALWDTGVEKSFISEDVYRRYFSYRSRQKTKGRVVTAQGATCCHLGRIELQIRIRDFQKTLEFHILNNMQYQYILGIDFMKESNLNLHFDKKSLIIPDDQIKQLPKVEKPVEIHLSNTKLGEGQKQKLKDLFNSFKGLFSDQLGLTHVLYQEIDTGD